MSKNNVSVEDLRGYLDEGLDEEDAARVERALRASAPLRQTLQRLVHERDWGDHSVGATWRRLRLSCPSREELGSLLLGILDESYAEYLRFHLDTIGCPYCQANRSDLQTRRREPATHGQQRRQKLFASSAGHLPRARMKT